MANPSVIKACRYCLVTNTIVSNLRFTNSATRISGEDQKNFRVQREDFLEVVPDSKKVRIVEKSDAKADIVC